MIFDLKFKPELMFNYKNNLIPNDKHNRIGADEQPNNMFKFTKAKDHCRCRRIREEGQFRKGGETDSGPRGCECTRWERKGDHAWHLT